MASGLLGSLAEIRICWVFVRFDFAGWVEMKVCWARARSGSVGFGRAQDLMGLGDLQNQLGLGEIRICLVSKFSVRIES